MITTKHIVLNHVHRANVRGDRITETCLVTVFRDGTPIGTSAVDLWRNFETGKLVKVGEPRELTQNEIAKLN